MKCLDEIKFDDRGLIPAVIQDYQNGEVLMLAYMNRDALRRTLVTGKTHFWSRSRKILWLKGEHSGHTQEVKEVYLDCDKDTVVVKVEQKVAACHTGYRSCFFRKLQGDGFTAVGDKVFDEDAVYKTSR